MGNSESSDEDQHVGLLTWNLTQTRSNEEGLIEFSRERFQKFYGCLCQDCVLSYSNYDGGNHDCPIEDEQQCQNYTNHYICYIEDTHNDLFSCHRLQKTGIEDLDLSRCRSYTSLDPQNTCNMNNVTITLDPEFSLQQVSYDPNSLEVNNCTIENMSTASHTRSIEMTPSISPNSSFETFTDNDEMRNQNDNTFVIIGVVLAVCFAVAVLVVLGVILWRRKKRPLTAGQDVMKNPEEYEMNRSDNQGGTGSGVESQTVEYSYADVNTVAVQGNDSNNTHQNSKMTSEDHHNMVHSEDNQTSGDRKFSDVSSPSAVYTYVDSSSNVKLQDTDGRTFHPKDGVDDGSYSAVTVSHSNASRGAYPGNQSLAQNPQSEVKATDVKNNNTESNSKGASEKDEITPAGDEYSRLHHVQREIANPYNFLPDTDPKNEYSRLHETQRHFQDPYNFLPDKQTNRQPHEYSTASNIDIVSETPAYSSVLPKSKR